jgi:hypothetical protein
LPVSAATHRAIASDAIVGLPNDWGLTVRKWFSSTYVTEISTAPPAANSDV